MYTWGVLEGGLGSNHPWALLNTTFAGSLVSFALGCLLELCIALLQVLLGDAPPAGLRR